MMPNTGNKPVNKTHFLSRQNLRGTQTGEQKIATF